MQTPSRTMLEALEAGQIHRFADFPTLSEIPRCGAAIYTIWDHAGVLVCVGVSGRSATSRTGPWGRYADLAVASWPLRSSAMSGTSAHVALHAGLSPSAPSNRLGA